MGMYLKIINQNCFFGNLSLELHIYYDKDSSANYVWQNTVKNLTIRFWNDFSMFTLVQPKATTSNVMFREISCTARECNLKYTLERQSN